MSMPSIKLVSSIIIFSLMAACAPKVAVKQTVDARNMQSAQVKPVVREKVLVSDQTKRLYQSALSDIQRSDYANAEKKLLSVIQQAPGVSTPQLNLGIIYLEQGRLSDAEAIFSQAVAANPMFVQAYNYLGIVLREQGKFTQAERAYSAALNINPNYAIAHRNIGILYDLYLRNYGKAAQHYARYSQLAPKDNKEVQAWLLDLQQRATASN